METNTLVKHKAYPTLGIGCVSKILKFGVRVNFGSCNAKLCKPDSLIRINVSRCKTITFQEYRTRILKDKSTLNMVIVGHELLHYVGIGWVRERVITEDDLTKYPRVIE